VVGASGKSQFFADCIIKAAFNYPVNIVCIREIQKSIKFSSKKILEDKIKQYGLDAHFDITQTEIRTPKGGIIIFQGMQDHTADSIKSLEGFDICWVEEAQNISKYSLELLIPTIRKQNSELWFSWNPRYEDDAIEQFFNGLDSSNSILIHSNYDENPLISKEIKEEAQRHKLVSPDTFGHVWLGEYSTISDAQVFKNKYTVTHFEVDSTFGEPLHGIDFGFAKDPTTANRIYIKDNCLFIRYESYKVGLELDYTADYIKSDIPNIEDYVIRADSARPESISYLKRKGLPKIEGVDKWPGSIEDGIEFMKSFEHIYIHTSCIKTFDEFRKYSYKIDKRTGDILPKIEDAHNDILDGIRYSLSPLIRKRETKVNNIKLNFA